MPGKLVLQEKDVLLALPQKIRDAIWREYRPGQERDKDPSLRYLAVQRLALAHSVFRAYDEKATLNAIAYAAQAMRYAKEAIAAGQGDPLEGLIVKQADATGELPPTVIGEFLKVLANKKK